jgi:putative acetyltransferase
MDATYGEYWVRDWRVVDRFAAAAVISSVLAEYGLGWEGEGADRDAVEVESYYLSQGGEFWVVERAGTIVGTAGYYPTSRGELAVEIRKMYLLDSVRGQGLGKYLLAELERSIAHRGYQQIWVETASVLATAVLLYEKSGYLPATGVETSRCDRIYQKKLTI